VSKSKIFSVSELTSHIKARLESDDVLSDLYVRGEISNFLDHSSGHAYFTLKDKNSVVRCVMFRSARKTLKFQPKDGMDVLVRGNVSVYEKSGGYQVYASEIQPYGIGALHLAFEELKVRLAKEGLFDVARKRKIPAVPRRIGIITSPEGAVIHDMLRVIRRRNPRVDILFAPVAVQGATAAQEIARAIELMNLTDVDVLIIGRGGGSLEELWAFNEEIVARAIYNSAVPVISAVGHETDFAISDFVADLRAPTPSVAGELVVRDIAELEKQLLYFSQILEEDICSMLEIYRGRCDAARDTIISSMTYRINLWKGEVERLANMLDAVNPLAILKRGYSISIKMPEEKVIKSVANVKREDDMKVIVSDGEIFCEVKETRAKQGN